jgi:uncharacterized protein YlzI (FlbEa/FlbD family)
MIRLKKHDGDEIWVNPFNIATIVRAGKDDEFKSFLFIISGDRGIPLQNSPEEVALYVRKFYEGRLIKRNG